MIIGTHMIDQFCIATKTFTIIINYFCNAQRIQMETCNKRRLICSADSFMHEVVSLNNHIFSCGLYMYVSK